MDVALNEIAKQGLLGVLLGLAICAIIYLFRELRKADRGRREDGETMLAAREQVSKERLDDVKTLVLALEQNSRANVALERSSHERSIAIQELTNGFSTLAAQIGSGQERVLEHLKTFERRMEDIDRGVARMLDRGAA